MFFVSEKLENPEPASLKPATKAAVSLFSNCIGTDHGPLIQPATKNRKMDNVNVKQAGGRGMCSTFTLSSPGVPSSNATCTTSTSVAPETLPFGYFNVAATSKPIFTMDTNTGTFALGSVTNKMLAPVSSLPTSAFDTLSTGIPTGTFNRSSGYSAGSIPTTLFSFNPPVIGGIPTDFKLPEFGGLASNSRPSVFGGLALNSKSPVFGWLTSNSNQPVFGGYTSNSNPPVFRGMATIGTNSFSITAAGNSSLAMTNQSSATADHRMASVNTSFDDAGNSGTNNSTAAANIIIFSTSDAEKNGTNKLPATTEKTLSTNITTSIGASKPSSSADQTWGNCNQ